MIKKQIAEFKNKSKKNKENDNKTTYTKLGDDAEDNENNKE